MFVFWSDDQLGTEVELLTNQVLVVFGILLHNGYKIYQH